jgi:hypothetical protein
VIFYSINITPKLEEVILLSNLIKPIGSKRGDTEKVTIRVVHQYLNGLFAVHMEAAYEAEQNECFDWFKVTQGKPTN